MADVALTPPPKIMAAPREITADDPQQDFMCPYLYRAAKSGRNSINRVKRLLELYHQEVPPAVDDQNNDGPVLNEWKWRGNDHGYGVCRHDEKTTEGNTVLHIAVEEKDLDLVVLIIPRYPTLLRSQNARHETPLHLAVGGGSRAMVDRIFSLAREYNISVHDIRSIEGDTILHEAVRHGHQNVVQEIMDRFPELSEEVNNANMSPLYLAVVKKFVGIVNTLLKHPQVSAAGPHQQNALHAAVLRGHDITRALLDWNPGLASEIDDTGSTPLHYAASIGDDDVVQLILNIAPSTVYIKDLLEGSTPLHVAAKMRHSSTQSLMIDCCPDSFELQDDHGRNIMHIHAQYGSRTYFSENQWKRLINRRDTDGNTPLHIASKNGFSVIIYDFLKVYGADPTIKNELGNTPLDLAVSESSSSVMAGAVLTLSAYGAMFSPQRLDRLARWNGEGTRKWIDKMSKNLIVVSVLIATIAFSAAFNVPGSYNDKGLANLGGKPRFKAFLLLDIMAMACSVGATLCLIVAKAVDDKMNELCFVWFVQSLNLMWISLMSMEVAFFAAVTVVLEVANTAIICMSLLLAATFLATMIIIPMLGVGRLIEVVAAMKILFPTKERMQTRRQIGIQLPSYVPDAFPFIFLVMSIWVFLYILVGFYIAYG